MSKTQTPKTETHVLKLVACGTRRADSLGERLRKRRIKLVWDRDLKPTGPEPRTIEARDDALPF